MTPIAKIKLLLGVLLPMCLITPFLLNVFNNLAQSPVPNLSQSEYYCPPHLMICNKTNSSTNYLGPNLISSNETDQVLCPGDTFGDLNETYITVKDCYLEMYHHDQIIWSSKSDKVSQSNKETEICALSLQKDGNLVLYNKYRLSGLSEIWESRTDLDPLKTELRVQNQQLNLIQTFEGGTERSFYLDANHIAQTFEDETKRLFYLDIDHLDFMEDLGEPKKIADKSFIKSYKDKDKIILQRNEYIGDLNGTHLIFQADCELQLRNRNKIIWSVASSFDFQTNCNVIQDRSRIRISGYWETIVSLDYGEIAIQSEITIGQNQFFIIQTLEDGTTRRFYSEPGHNTELKLKKELRQIAKNNLTVPFDRIYNYLTIQKLDYIGNLSGLHIILQDNCTFMLADGNKTLWEYSDKSKSSSKNCEAEIDLDYGKIKLIKSEDHEEYSFQSIFGSLKNQHMIPIMGAQLALGNSLMVLTFELENGVSKIYHASQNTRGTWFQFISEHSVKVKALKTDKTLPILSYIGDLHGVYAVLEESCNWVLYNKTRVIWESGVSQDGKNYCDVVLKKDGSVVITSDDFVREKNIIWSTQGLTVDNEKQVLSTEILVNNDGLWLVNFYMDGTEKKFKAKEGTNSFALVQSENPGLSLF